MRYHTFKKLPSRHYDSELSASEICGESLEKAGIPQGYMVAVVKGGAVSSGDLIAVKVSDEPEGQLVRYVFFGPGGWIRLQTADRDEYPDLIYAPGEFEIVGPVVHAEPAIPLAPPRLKWRCREITTNSNAKARIGERGSQ
jgi:phage repressor protein C with HTH and peptisase S24 domain